jgi:DNA (cytosine-5)-methyltransferase 1
MIRYGSVCSGIEAATAAWHPLGWEASFFSEIEPFPRAVLAHHYPNVPLHGDFTTIKDGDYEPIDLLVGGTPCQSFSVAGLRGGLDDDRGNLALEFLRLADRTRPRWLVWENVPGVLSSGGGRDFGSILGGLVELGYGFAYRVLDAQYFGVAQRRRRVFVVGYLGDWRRAAAVLFEQHSLSGHPAPSRETRQGATVDVAGCLATGGGGRAFPGTSAQDAGQGYLVAQCLTTGTGQRYDAETETLIPTHGGGFDVAAFEWQRGATQNLELTDNFSPALIKSQTPAVAYPINTQMALRGADTSNTSREGIGVGDDGDPAFTLQAAHSHAVAFEANMSFATPDTSGVNPTLTRRHHASVATQSAVRRLTPVECERLQGFPDNYTAIPWRGKDQTPDGPRYKALGNSMAVPVMRWIGERIQEQEK